MSFSGQFTQIKGISDRRRLPRLGKIRLGFKLKTKDGKEYPAELPFFLLPEDVARVYGGKVSVERAQELGVTRADVLAFVASNIRRLAEEIDIMLPLDATEAVFPQAYKWYGGQKGIKCMGNGEIAMRLDEGSKSMVERECPCEMLKSDENPKGECTQRAHLQCLVPRVSMGGVYQIDLGSYNSIVDINSGMDYVRALVGRIAMIPLKLRRIPTQTHHDGRKQVHYTLQLLMDVPIERLEELRRNNTQILLHSQVLMLAPPEDINPAFDIEGEVVEEGAVEAPEGILPVPEVKPDVKTETPEHPEHLLSMEDMKFRLETSITLKELEGVWKDIQTDYKKLLPAEQVSVRMSKDKTKSALKEMK